MMFELLATFQLFHTKRTKKTIVDLRFLFLFAVALSIGGLIRAYFRSPRGSTVAQESF